VYDIGFGCGLGIYWEAPEHTDGLLNFICYMDGIEVWSEVYNGGTGYGVVTQLEYGMPSHTFQLAAHYEHCEDLAFTEEIASDPCIYNPQLCEKPTELSGTAEETTALLTWNEPENIDGVLKGYNIYRDDVKLNDAPINGLAYNDEELANGTYMYQVAAVYLHCDESDRTDGVSVTILMDGINHFTSANFEIYPNPTTSVFTIESGKLKIENVEIFDVYGRKLLSHTAHRTPHTVLNVSHLQSGIYFIRITTSNNVVIKKIIKN
jgi:hypothetical protein